MLRKTRISTGTSLRGAAAIAAAGLLSLVALPGGAAAAPNQPAPRGCDVAVYWGPGYAGETWRTGDDHNAVGPHWSKQIASIVVVSGIWDFYAEADFRGEVFTLPPGAYPYVGDRWNKRIMSFRCVRSDAAKP